MAPARTTQAITFVFLGLLFTASNAFNYGEFVLYSDPPQSLLPGQKLVNDMTPHGIPFGPHELSFQRDCNLTLCTNTSSVWSTNTSLVNGQDCYLTLLPDGELVLRHSLHYPVWSSGVKSTSGSYAFILTWDGKLSVFGPELWPCTNKAVLSEPDAMVTSVDYVLYSYQVTPASYGILITFKNFRLVLREDCNLILEGMKIWNILWQTNTRSPYCNCFTYLDERGELFVKHNRREILWRSGKRADKPVQYPKAHVMALRYDGRLIIYHPQIWSAGARIKESRFIAE